MLKNTPPKKKNKTKTPLQLINEISKVSRYEINTRISVMFLYTNSEQSEKEMKIMPFPIASLTCGI